MNSKLTCAIAVMTLTVNLGAYADVSLDSCRNMALRNNKTIRLAEEGIRSARYEKKAAFANYLPGIDFTGGYMYNQQQIELLGEDAKLPTMSFDPATQQFKYNILTTPDGTPIKDPSSGSLIPTEVAVIPKEAMEYDTHNVFAGAFTLTQPIFMGGMIKAMNDITKYAENAAVAMKNSAVQDVVYGVDQAYWTVVSLREKKRLADSFVALVDSLNQNVQALLDEGMATRSDLLTVQVSLNQAKIARTKVDNGLSLSRMALAQLCGLPVHTEMTLEDEGGSDDLHRTAPQEVNMSDVYARRSDLEVIRQSINVLGSREKLALGAMLPKVAAVGMYSFSNPNVNHGFEKKFGGGFSVGATITIPLWHWGRDINHYRATQATTNAQRMLLEDLEEKVQLQVSQAQYSFNEAYKTYEMTLSNMASAEENLRSAQLGYMEGVLTTDDVIAAQTAWLAANSEKIDAQIAIRLCDVYLSKVLGTLAP
ncbi:TolC family protein [bacterium]|nr:TolC family protein [Bacteroidales bacterium]MBD5292502.1 TolC family protein [Bacteroides sp.]MBD5338440.1 TolC family protein [Bacteroides sp.]MBD5385928.1 TolC family protein [bacterium]MDE6806564.1 TolC family protein [Muribaculaceae bacterium]